MASYCAKRRVFHVPIIPCFCHFATLIPHFSANLHLCIFPNIPANAAFSFVLPESDLRDIAPDVPASAAFSFKFLTSDLRGIAPTFRQAPLFLSKFSQAICVASPRRSGKRRFLGKKSSKDVTRRTGIHAQHIFPDASLLFFVLFSNRTKASLSHATNFKNYTGNSSIISDNSGLSGVNAGSHYIFLPKNYENGNFVCFGISLPSFAVKFLARSALSRA